MPWRENYKYLASNASNLLCRSIYCSYIYGQPSSRLNHFHLEAVRSPLDNDRFQWRTNNWLQRTRMYTKKWKVNSWLIFCFGNFFAHELFFSLKNTFIESKYSRIFLYWVDTSFFWRYRTDERITMSATCVLVRLLGMSTLTSCVHS